MLPEQVVVHHFLADARDRFSAARNVTGDACERLYRAPSSLQLAARSTIAAPRPRSVVDVQATVRSANRFSVSLWPISSGEDLGYFGTSSSAMARSCSIFQE